MTFAKKSLNHRLSLNQDCTVLVKQLEVVIEQIPYNVRGSNPSQVKKLQNSNCERRITYCQCVLSILMISMIIFDKQEFQSLNFAILHPPRL